MTYSHFKGVTAIWLAATDEHTEGTWIWDSGPEMLYADWLPGSPDNQNDADSESMGRSTV